MNGDYDPAPRLPVSPGERIVVALVGLGFIALIVADLARGFSHAKLSVAFVLAFWGPLLVLHELGHACVARLVGWHVTEIVIGFGRELLRFRVGGTRVRIRALPVEGYVVPSPNNTARARAKQAAIYFGGPLTELLLILCVGAYLDWEGPKASDSVGRIALHSLAITAGIGVVMTLFPYRSGGNPSDGLGMLLSWLAPEESFRQRLCWPFLAEGQRLLLREQVELARRAVESGLAQYPEEPRLRGLLGVCEAAAGRAEQAFKTLEAIGGPDEQPPPVRAALLSDAAWAVLFSGDEALLPDAQRALQRALEEYPDEPHYLVLLGRIHLERGRPEAAYEALMTAYKRTRDADQEAQCVAYLALACEGHRGMPGAQRVFGYTPRFARATRSLDVPPRLRQRVLETCSPS